MTDLRERISRELSHAYDIERELPGGGMSRVFVAVERALGRRVVIKVLPPELAAGVNIERFRREIQLSAQLNHPHIVTVLSTGELGDILYYTMPYIEGESLNSTVERNGPLDTKEVLRILHDVVDAIAYAHSRGVIHRDIKPANILQLGNHAVVTDFGVAKAISAALPSTGVTSGGFAIGTPAYMAPEQLAADPQADHRVDIYAVGLLAYELFTGTSPFMGTSPQATMAAQLTRVPEPLHKLRPDVPASVSGLIQRCLEKLPENRPDTAQELLRELDAISTPQGQMTGGRPSLGAALANPGRHVRYLSGMAAALIAVGTAAYLTTSFIIRKAGELDAATLLAPGDSATISDRDAYNALAPASLPVAAASDTNHAVLVTEQMLEAFADSIREQLLGERRRDSAIVSDSLRAAVEREVLDSLNRMRIAAQRGSPDARRFSGRIGSPAGSPAALRRPPFPGERRVLILDFQTRSVRADSSRIGAQFADSLRVALARTRVFTAVGSRVAREVAASSDPRVMVEAVSAGAVITGSIVNRRGDSATVRVALIDASRPQVPRSIGSWPLSVTSSRVVIDSILPRMVEALNTVTWPAGAPGGRNGGGRRSGAPPPAPDSAASPPRAGGRG